jgi:hypothetical protein
MIVMTPRPQSALFKTCPMCGDLWGYRADFLSDPYVIFLGYQPGAFLESSGGFLFNHVRCGTTLAVPLATFLDLSPEPEITDSCATRGVQEEFCLGRKENKICPPQCRCASVAHSARVLQNWPKERLT